LISIFKEMVVLCFVLCSSCFVVFVVLSSCFVFLCSSCFVVLCFVLCSSCFVYKLWTCIPFTGKSLKLGRLAENPLQTEPRVKQIDYLYSWVHLEWSLSYPDPSEPGVVHKFYKLISLNLCIKYRKENIFKFQLP